MILSGIILFPSSIHINEWYIPFETPPVSKRTGMCSQMEWSKCCKDYYQMSLHDPDVKSLHIGFDAQFVCYSAV